MAVNTQVYGTVTDWDLYRNGGNPNPDLRVYCLHDYIYSRLTTPIGMPIDKSLACSGLGVESVFSNIKWYYTGDLAQLGEGGGGDATPTFIDNRAVTNWCFGDTRIVYNGSVDEYNQKGSVIIDGDQTESSTEPGLYRYAPEPAYENDILHLNPSNIKPIVQFAHKNLVALLYVNVSDSLGLFPTMHTYILKEYLDSYTTTYPYIYGVFFRLFLENENTTPIQRMALNAESNCAVAILDSANLPIIKTYFYNLVSFNGRDIKLMGGFPSQTGRFTVRGSTSADNKTYIGACVTDAWKMHIFSGDVDHQESQGYVYRQYSSTFEKECYEQMACFGLLFTANEQTALSGAITDNLMMCGILDENLIGHGEYTHGAPNAENAQINWTNSNDSTYNPAFRPDPNRYNGEMGTHDIPLFGSATERYNLSAFSTQLSLLPKLWDVMALADPDADKLSYTLDMFLASNPIDSIVSLQFLPVKDMGDYEEGHTVYLGKYNTGISARVAKTSIRFDCGDYEIYPVFGDNWIDREIQISLYLPFCGTINLEPEVYMNKIINVEYMIDLTTGSCSAVVSMTGDNGKKIITDVASGSCAIDLPVTGIQQQTLNSQLFNASETTKQLKVNNSFKGFRSLMGAVSSLNGDPMGSINSILGAGQDIYNIFQGEKIADYNLHHTMIPTKMIGTSGALTGAMCELKPTIIFSRPVLDYNENFAHCQGFACCITAALTEYTGYTEVINPDLSGFAATAAEKEMIKSLLASGVYL